MLDPRFFNLLLCPACRGALKEHEADSALYCSSCRYSFPVIEGIPVLFPCNVKEKRDDLFKRHWDSEEMAEHYAQEPKKDGSDDPFFLYDQESEIAGLTRCYDSTKLGIVLDAGCGAGRFLETFPQDSVKVGADASLNLLFYSKRLRRGDFLVCCELEHLPFKSGTFDTVISCRVLQHLQRQELAIREMARVAGPRGDVILELYNSWNPKTLYKSIRKNAKLGRFLDTPFKMIRSSWSPFGLHGLDYDHYNNWFEVKRWLQAAGMRVVAGHSVGFGYHKYFFQPFAIHSILKRAVPGLLKKYYDACFRVEQALGKYPLFKETWEKFVIKGTHAAEGSSRSIPARMFSRGERLVRSSPFFNGDALRETRRERDNSQATIGNNRSHLIEALEWLKRAQDVTWDRGVSRGYSVAWQPQGRGPGWQPSYPETTGYIIPTFFDCASWLNDPDCTVRAVEMADWEIASQMPNGAVMGSTIDVAPKPAVFNTGQVILGWLRTHSETGDDMYLDAAERAGRFLIGIQGEDGGWHKENSPYADASLHTYNSRVGWAMILLGMQSGTDAFTESGMRNLQFTILQQQENGWFKRCCLNDVTAPLTHTLCYAIEGLLGGFEALRDQAYMECTKLAAGAMMGKIGENGSLPGRFDANWNPRVEWSCLTGCAQLAGILLKLYTITDETTYQAEAQKLLRFLKSTQNCVSDQEGLRGGIKGSHPFSAPYGRYELLNWPTKFFIDALLLDEHL